MIGRKRFRKKIEPGIAITFFQIAQHLVIAPVFFDDINDVADLAAQERKELLVFRPLRWHGKMIVPRRQQRKFFQLGWRWQRNHLQ